MKKAIYKEENISVWKEKKETCVTVKDEFGYVHVFPDIKKMVDWHLGVWPLNHRQFLDTEENWNKFIGRAE